MTLEELKALLRRAGLEIVEPWWAAGPLPLRDTETAEQAARHPGLPLPVIRRMPHEMRERGVA
jgi:hypothetical protein